MTHSVLGSLVSGGSRLGPRRSPTDPCLDHPIYPPPVGSIIDEPIYSAGGERVARPGAVARYQGDDVASKIVSDGLYIFPVALSGKDSRKQFGGFIDFPIGQRAVS